MLEPQLKMCFLKRIAKTVHCHLWLGSGIFLLSTLWDRTERDKGRLPDHCGTGSAEIPFLLWTSAMLKSLCFLLIRSYDRWPEEVEVDSTFAAIENIHRGGHFPLMSRHFSVRCSKARIMLWSSAKCCKSYTLPNSTACSLMSSWKDDEQYFNVKCCLAKISIQPFPS